MAAEKFELLMSRGRHLAHDEGLDEKENNSEEVIDEELLQTGISFFTHNFFSMFVSMLTGLLSLMYIETIASVLSATKKSSSGVLNFKRYLSTLNHTVQWYRDLPSLIKSSARVRVLHKQAAAVRKFSQFEMVVTQWAFVGPVLLWPDRLGVDRRTEKDIEGVLYVMMMVGRQLGISDEFNLCRGDLEQCTEYSRLLLEKIIKPSFNSPDASDLERVMSQYLLEGINILNPFISPPAFLLWSGDLIHEKKSSFADNLRYSDRFLYRTQSIFLGVLRHFGVVGGLIRLLANNLMRLNIYLANEWMEFIVSQQDRNNKLCLGIDLGAAEAFLLIPVLVIISSFNIAYRSIVQFRSEIFLIVIFTTCLVILPPY